MPQYEYACEECEVEFSELLLNKADSEKYLSSHPCPVCSNPAARKMSSFSFGFKGSVRGLSGVHGNSGVHDLDYPSLDKAVARSSEAKWGNFRKQQLKTDKVRQETGSHALTEDSSGNLKPTDSRILDLRAKAINSISKASPISKNK